MREQFVKEFVTKLVNQIPDDALKIVYQKLTIFVSDYEIEPRKTEIVPYEGYLPECYEIYFCDTKNRGSEHPLAGAVQHGPTGFLFSDQ